MGGFRNIVIWLVIGLLMMALYNVFQTSNESPNNEDPTILKVHENVKMRQVLRYDLRREDLLKGTSQVSILDEVHKGEIGIVEELSEERDIELAAEDLKMVRSAFDEFLGVKYPDDLLGDIFNDFCIGK